jgi:DNA-binding NarL/FixJ family response regulator
MSETSAVSSASADGAARERDLRLAILDRHRLFRECLARALEEQGGYEVVVLAAAGNGAFERLADLDADLLVLGLEGPDSGGAELVREAASRVPGLKTLVVSFAHDHHQVLECLEAGAGGCVFREQSLAEVRAAIDGVVRGETVVPSLVAGTLFSRLGELGRRRRGRERLERLTLTPRELEVLHLVADGLSNGQIARRLCLSIHTIKNHVHKILETLEVHSRWEAARLAYRKGWLLARRRGGPAPALGGDRF